MYTSIFNINYKNNIVYSCHYIDINYHLSHFKIVPFEMHITKPGVIFDTISLIQSWIHEYE